MTSPQLRARLDAAIAIVADCERLMEDPYAAADSWAVIDLSHRVRDFMDLHRQTIAEGGRP